MLIRELDEKTAENLPTDDDKIFVLLGKTYVDKFKTLWYKKIDAAEWYAINLTNDNSCWVIGGEVYDSQTDLPDDIK